MSTATRGTVLAGRYRLEERIHSNPDGSVWQAVDATLDRRVSVRVMRPAHPFAADVADAARRAALIDDDRLVRVLDVGSDGDVVFVVSEDVDGDSLALLVERSPLAPPAVRRIIGEVAQGLQGAALRGLHHLRLTPRSVVVCRDGTVKIAGTAVEAAAAGLEPDHAATASRVDTVALVGLLYSGLTGRWPLGDAGFPPAPRGEGGAPVPPADLVPGIPNDLDTLCVVTLGGADDGPLTPAELVTELAPWPSAREAPLRAAARRLPPETTTAPLGPDSPLKIRSLPTGRRGGAKPGRSTGPSAPVTDAAAGTARLQGSGAPEPPIPPGTTPRRSASLFPTPSVAATGSLPIPKEPTGAGPRRMDSLFTQQTVYPGSATPPAAVAPDDDTRPNPAGSGPGRDQNPPGATIDAIPEVMAPTDPPARPAPSSRALRATGVTPTGRGRDQGQPAPTTPERSGPGRAPADQSFLPWSPPPYGPGTPSALDSTGPFPILIPAETPPREQSRLVIFSITVVLVLGLLVAAFSLRDLGSGDDVQPVDDGTALPTRTAAPVVPSAAATTATTAPTTTAPITTTPTATATAAAVPVGIGAIRAIDPQGDGDEDTADSPRAVDGDTSTTWKSQTYRSSSFGGLKKGVGLAIKLKKPAAVSAATIEVRGSGGAVELRTASGPDLSSSKVVGKGTMKNGKVTVEATGAKPAKYVILWFTELPSVGGAYKIEVSEVRLK